MQWNTTNISKKDFKQKQDEFIKAAIEMSKKSKNQEQNPVPVAKAVFIDNTKSSSKTDDSDGTEVAVANEFTQQNPDTPELSDIQNSITEDKEQNSIQTKNDETISEPLNINNLETITTMNEKAEVDETAEIRFPEELEENIFITEKEAEEKLKAIVETIEKQSIDNSGFNKYIETHNNEKTSEKSMNSTADE